MFNNKLIDFEFVEFKKKLDKIKNFLINIDNFY